MPTGITQAVLQGTFSYFGIIESVRVLTHKNCAFINYETKESAMAARDALVQNELSVQELWGVRVGFAKVPPPGITKNDEAMLNKELWDIMKQLVDHEEDSSSLEFVQCKYPRFKTKEKGTHHLIIYSASVFHCLFLFRIYSPSSRIRTGEKT